MRNKILSFIVASVMLISSLTACGANSRYNLVPQKYPMRIQLDSSKDPVDDEMNLYFVNGGDIPYVALSEYMPFVGSIYKDEYIDIPAVEYEITHPMSNRTLVTRKDNGAMMDIDTELDTIEFVGMDYFTAVPGNSLLMSVITMSADGKGGASNLFNDTGGSYERNGSALLKFDLKEYSIDLIEKDGECYMPLQTVNDLLVSQNYVYVVFNREKVFVSSFGAKVLDEMYDAPTGEMSEDFAFFNYNELRFMLDTFYGLKTEHGIEDFGDFLMSANLIEPLAGTDPKAFDRAIRQLTMKYFDDGHSGRLKTSYLTGKTDPNDPQETMELFEDIGSSTNDLSWATLRAKGMRYEYYLDHPEMDSMNQDAKKPWLYEEVGDTAIITFDSFEVNKRDYYKEADLKNPADTIELIAYAHSQITREGSPIKNVVVDLSCNGGGAADAAVFVMSWLKVDGSSSVALRNTLTGAQSIGTYEADINLDGEFGPDDQIDPDINRYILIGQPSFSCGNLVPTSLKGCPNITIIGQTSGGGSCVVRPCTTASGTVFTISSPTQISIVKNGSLYNADQGVVPDVYINKTDTMYNRSELVDYIHNIR